MPRFDVFFWFRAIDQRLDAIEETQLKLLQAQRLELELLGLLMGGLSAEDRKTLEGSVGRLEALAAER